MRVDPSSSVVPRTQFSFSFHPCDSADPEQLKLTFPAEPLQGSRSDACFVVFPIKPKVGLSISPCTGAVGLTHVDASGINSTPAFMEAPVLLISLHCSCILGSRSTVELSMLYYSIKKKPLTELSPL